MILCTIKAKILHVGVACGEGTIFEGTISQIFAERGQFLAEGTIFPRLFSLHFGPAWSVQDGFNTFILTNRCLGLSFENKLDLFRPFADQISIQTIFGRGFGRIAVPSLRQ